MGKLTKEIEALFLAGQHCQGGHSDAGQAIADVLGLPFPLTMAALMEGLRERGENPALFYPWLIRAGSIVHGINRGKHPYFTEAELAAAPAGRAALSQREGE